MVIFLFGFLFARILSQPTNVCLPVSCVANDIHCPFTYSHFCDRSGILENLLEGILTTPDSTAPLSSSVSNDIMVVTSTLDYQQSLQTSFDLLGEIVKCNILTLAMMEEYLQYGSSGESGNDSSQSKGNKWKQFSDILLNNLVSSNVFIRSMFFTLSVFDGAVDNQKKDKDVMPGRRILGYLSDSCQLLSPVQIPGNGGPCSVAFDTQPIRSTDIHANECEYGKEIEDRFPMALEFYKIEKINVIYQLMNIVNIWTVNHESVCCVNTVISLLLFEHKRFVSVCMCHALLFIWR